MHIFTNCAPDLLIDNHVEKVDVVVLGNLCVDILLPAATIPPEVALKTETFLSSLAAEVPSEQSWEVGGNCNFLIAASRIGLRCACIGHICDDKYGSFLRKVLAEEGILVHHLAPPKGVVLARSDTLQTLLCFVLTDGFGKHAFCSRYDIGPWPLLPDIGQLDYTTELALSMCSAVVVNVFVFDELGTAAVQIAVKVAKDSDAGIIFDPGPRAFSFSIDNDRREILKQVLSAANVVLATVDEAAALVDFDDMGLPLKLADGSENARLPKVLAQALWTRPYCVAEWIVIKCGPDGAVLFTRDGLEIFVGSPSVDVADTVGCGDSAAAAIVLGYLNIKKARQQARSEKGSEDLSKEILVHMLEETLTLATAVGAATAMRAGAGRNVATAKLVRTLLSKCIGSVHQDPGGFAISSRAAEQAMHVLDSSLRTHLRKR